MKCSYALAHAKHLALFTAVCSPHPLRPLLASLLFDTIFTDWSLVLNFAYSVSVMNEASDVVIILVCPVIPLITMDLVSAKYLCAPGNVMLRI